MKIKFFSTLKNLLNFKFKLYDFLIELKYYRKKIFTLCFILLYITYTSMRKISKKIKKIFTSQKVTLLSNVKQFSLAVLNHSLLIIICLLKCGQL